MQIGLEVIMTKKYTREMFLGNNLISWFNKKLNRASLSIVEAYYIAIRRSYTRLLWTKQMLKKYNVE